ncbi:MAG: hypothetical protein R3D01_11605 [Hyphomicrobiales bacterium]
MPVDSALDQLAVVRLKINGNLAGFFQRVFDVQILVQLFFACGRFASFASSAYVLLRNRRSRKEQQDAKQTRGDSRPHRLMTAMSNVPAPCRCVASRALNHFGYIY